MNEYVYAVEVAREAKDGVKLMGVKFVMLQVDVDNMGTLTVTVSRYGAVRVASGNFNSDHVACHPRGTLHGAVKVASGNCNSDHVACHPRGALHGAARAATLGLGWDVVARECSNCVSNGFLAR